MHKLAIFFALIFSYTGLFAQSNIHHKLWADVDIANKHLKVTDSLFIPIELSDSNRCLFFDLGKQFDLHNNSISWAGINLVKENTKTNTYRLCLADSYDFSIPISIDYEATIDGNLDKGEEYNKSFSTTDGIILPNGAYLAGSTHWVADFGKLFTFELNILTEMEFTSVSQGNKTHDEIFNDKKRITYSCLNPMDEAYLIVGKFYEYERQVGDVLVQAFMRKEENELVKRYFDRTEEDLSFYQNLIGPYPYRKFAIIENFWETGYGMPSFTLLGPQVIRFPWILYTSYPHELLHNWWGNSVYVDYSQGNWCEGITAYMADHLFKEQQGQGKEYRINELQKFKNYVTPENDIPLSEFLSRSNAAEQAIGYGKSLMVYHMLRKHFGDSIFVAAWQHFYKNNRFKKASYNDIKNSFEALSGADLDWYFNQWIYRKGAPRFTFKVTNAKKTEKGSRLTINISQIQASDVFEMDVPMAFYLDGEQNARLEWFHMTQKSQNFTIDLPKRPFKIALDPNFDIFRIIENGEAPPSFSELLGAQKILIVVPRQGENMYKYADLAKSWQIKLKEEGKKVDILQDREVLTYPEYDAIWVFGEENKFVSLFRTLPELLPQIPKEDQDKFESLGKSGSLIYCLPNPSNTKQILGFLALHSKSGFATITAKLPHYGKYSYIGFEAENTRNRLKGFFPASTSPLVKVINFSENKINTGMKPPVSKALGK